MSDVRSAFGPLVEEPPTDTEPRCVSCGRLLAEMVTRPWIIRCTRCKATNLGFLPHQEAAMTALAEAVEARQGHRGTPRPVSPVRGPQKGAPEPSSQRR